MPRDLWARGCTSVIQNREQIGGKPTCCYMCSTLVLIMHKAAAHKVSPPDLVLHFVELFIYQLDLPETAVMWRSTQARMMQTPWSEVLALRNRAQMFLESQRLYPITKTGIWIKYDNTARRCWQKRIDSDLIVCSLSVCTLSAQMSMIAPKGCNHIWLCSLFSCSLANLHCQTCESHYTR